MLCVAAVQGMNLQSGMEVSGEWPFLHIKPWHHALSHEDMLRSLPVQDSPAVFWPVVATSLTVSSLAFLSLCDPPLFLSHSTPPCP